MDALEGGKSFDILVKGDKASVLDTVEALKKKVGYANEYSVRFFYKEILSCNEGYLFRVTKDNCEMYNLSVSFFKKIVAQGMRNTEELVYARTFPTWESYVEGIFAESTGYFEPLSEIDPEWVADQRSFWIAANTDKFCDLSQAMQIWVINRSLNFSGGGAVLHEAGLMGIVYGDGNLWGKSALQQMRLMEADKAQDTCGGIAKAEVTAISQIGIEVIYQQDPGHAWTMVYPYNSDGQKLCYLFDYGLYGTENGRAEHYGVTSPMTAIY